MLDNYAHTHLNARADMRQRIGHRPAFKYASGMNQIFADNVRTLMLSLGEDQGEFAKRFGVTQGTVSRWGSSLPRGDKLAQLAEMAGVSVDHFLHERIVNPGKASDPDKRAMPKVGYVGAGAAVYAYENEDLSSDTHVEVPKGIKGNVAVEVKGDSLYPIAEDGWHIIYMGAKTLDEERTLNTLCVVQLEDGRTLVKKVLRGSRAGLYHLLSANAPLIEDVRLQWAAKVEAIIPR